MQHTDNSEKGIIETFRKGVKHYDKIIDLYYSELVSNYNIKALKNFVDNLQHTYRKRSNFQNT